MQQLEDYFNLIGWGAYAAIFACVLCTINTIMLIMVLGKLPRTVKPHIVSNRKPIDFGPNVELR